jgi:TM2 domain-containing membrane protein YozV
MLFLLAIFSVITPLNLADSLYSSCNFYDAATEYGRYLYNFSDDINSDYVQFRLGLSYLKSNEYSKAETTLRKIIAASNQYSPKAQLVLIEHFLQNQQYAMARIETQDLLLFNEDSTILQKSNRILGGIELVEGNLNQATNQFALAGDLELVKETENLKHLPRKNPVLAMLFSSLIPGSGEIYSGHYVTGIAAFLINAASLTAFIYSINKKNYVDATLVFSIFFTRFYLGSRQNAYDFANEYNEKLYQQRFKQINQRYNLLPNP